MEMAEFFRVVESSSLQSSLSSMVIRR